MNPTSELICSCTLIHFADQPVGTSGDGHSRTDLKDVLPINSSSFGAIFVQLEKSAEYGSHPEWNDNMGGDKVLSDR